MALTTTAVIATQCLVIVKLNRAWSIRPQPRLADLPEVAVEAHARLTERAGRLKPAGMPIGRYRR